MTFVPCFTYLNKAITQISRVAPLKEPRPGTRKTGLEKQLRSMIVTMVVMVVMVTMVSVTDTPDTG